MKNTIIFLLIFFVSAGLYGQQSNYEYENYTKGNDTLPYRIMYPAGFDYHHPYPVVFFLHGSGERGNDNDSQLTHGGSFLSSDFARSEYPAVVVFPQCSTNDYWAKVDFGLDSEGKRTFSFRPDLEPNLSMKMLMSLVDSITGLEWADKSQLYVGGLSMGGMGTFELLFRKPDLFAAAFPICGGGLIETTSAYAEKVSLWIFHGEIDSVVPVKFSKDMADAIKKNGGDVHLTIYPEVNHNAWDYVFLEKELLPWLFSRRK